MRLSTLLLVFTFVLLYACKGSPDRPEPMLDPSAQPSLPGQTATPAVNSTAVSNAGVTGTVYHYTCPNGCGGGDAAGTCPVCGTAYTHNQAFHNQSGQTTATTTATATGSPNITTSAAQTREPAQNAAGVWHYTCSSGCAGGAGSAVACATCGTTLVHNTLYHQ